MGQNDTNMQNTPPAFSGQAPSTNPFSAQNTIPSSATGDIVLEPTTPPKKSKKPLIIALLVGIIVIACLAIMAITLTRPKNQSSSEALPPVSSEELISSFNILANTLISGKQSPDTPALDTTITNWRLMQVDDSAPVDAQYNYASELKSTNDSYLANATSYLSNHSSQSTSTFKYDTDIITLKNETNKLTDKIYSLVIYFRANQFAANIKAENERNPDSVQEMIDKEIKSVTINSDEPSREMVANIRSYYNEIISPNKNDKTISTLIQKINGQFSSITNQLASSLKMINTVLGGINE